MLNYQSEYPSRDFLKLENEAIVELSPNALVMYINLRKLQSNEENSIEKLILKAKLTKNGLKEAKKELISKGYLETKQLYDNKYAYYIGKTSVNKYKIYFKKSENRIVKYQIKCASIIRSLEG